jgi:hypothetical protein
MSAATEDTSLRKLYPVVIIGSAAKNLLAVRIGELVRAYLLARKEVIGKGETPATIIVGRVLEGLTLIFFLVIFSLRFALAACRQQMEYVSLLIFGRTLLLPPVLIYREDWAPREGVGLELYSALPRHTIQHGHGSPCLRMVRRPCTRQRP